MPVPFRYDAAALNLSPRVFTSTAVTGSPAAASETIVCTVTTSGDIAAALGAVILFAVAYTVGTSGVSARYRVRQTNVAGTVLFDSGVTTAGIAAAALVNESVQAIDTAPVLPGQVYVLTLTIGSGAATSTVSAANGIVIVV
jgi:hypothetical protein